IFALGTFDDVEVRAWIESGDVRLVYRVVESPAVGAVFVDGANAMNEEAVIAASEVLPGAAFRQSIVQGGIGRLRKEDGEKGYRKIEIEPRFARVRDVGGDEIDVCLRVVEHEKVIIGKWAFVGIENATDAELRAAMDEEPGFNVVGGLYAEDRIARE